MKSEPLMTYNHMNDENSSEKANSLSKQETYPISLYMLLVVDALLITGVIFLTAKIIF